MSRTRAVVRALLALAAASAVSLTSVGRAQDAAPIVVRLTLASSVVRLNETGELLADVTTDATASGPLLLTPTSDGPAIEVVRGRLLRADAEDPRAAPLRFHVPWVANRAGDAVVRVRVDGWSCVAPRDGVEPRCRPVRSEAAVTLTVRP